MATDSHGHVRSSPERIELERGALAVRNDRSIGGSLDVLEEGLFHSLLVRERRRAQRSGQAFILILLEVVSPNGSAESLSREIPVVLTSSLRETDTIGWYQKGRICGVIVTDVALERTSDVQTKAATENRCRPGERAWHGRNRQDQDHHACFSRRLGWQSAWFNC